MPIEIRKLENSDISRIGELDRGEIIEQIFVHREGGTLQGALDGDKLAGFLIYAPDLAPNVAQLAVLHVGRPYRRTGLGRDLSLSHTHKRHSGILPIPGIQRNP